jgi:ABC-type transporter Mla maintaining outer membrane lipid asymmetry ATPase subunit MlaF
VVELESVDVPSLAEPNAVVLRNVSWRVHQGDAWLVAGPPGAGKSSLLGVAAGLVRPIRGSHRLFGQQLTHLAENDQAEYRARVGVVFGGGGRLFSHLTVLENVALPLQYHCTDRAIQKRVNELLAGFELMEYAGQYPRALPRRIAQRVALARALALEPEILLMDDPLAGLTPRESAWWLESAGPHSRHRVPPTLVIASTSLEPWTQVARLFGWVEDGAWQVVDNAESLAGRLLPARAD